MRDRKANRTTFLPRLLGTPSASQTGTGYIYNAWCSLGSLCPRKRRWQGFGPHEPRKRGMIVARAFRTLPTVEISLISGRSGVGHQRGSEHGQTGRPSRGTRPARPPQRTKSRKPPNVAVLEFPLALVCRVWPAWLPPQTEVHVQNWPGTCLKIALLNQQIIEKKKREIGPKKRKSKKGSLLPQETAKSAVRQEDGANKKTKNKKKQKTKKGARFHLLPSRCLRVCQLARIQSHTRAWERKA